jgi:hypothetical protein
VAAQLVVLLYGSTVRSKRLQSKQATPAQMRAGDVAAYRCPQLRASTSSAEWNEQGEGP